MKGSDMDSIACCSVSFLFYMGLWLYTSADRMAVEQYSQRIICLEKCHENWTASNQLQREREMLIFHRERACDLPLRNIKDIVTVSRAF